MMTELKQNYQIQFTLTSLKETENSAGSFHQSKESTQCIPIEDALPKDTSANSAGSLD